jgi:Anti-sigma factor NepR
MLWQEYSCGWGKMSDESEKTAKRPDTAAEKAETSQAEDMPEDVVAAVDGEIDLARLAPQLRGLYQELLNEPIPDRFTKLLDELAGKENNKR